MSYWYVIYTRPRWEKKVSRLLEERGIVNYCPLNRVYKQWSDRRKVVQEPLFKGYVFINISEDQMWEIKNINGVVNYVYWLGKPAKVRNDEIENIRKFLGEFENVEVIDNQLKEREAVIITRGVLSDYKGIVLELIGNKARVKIDSMGISLCAVFDKKNLVHV